MPLAFTNIFRNNTAYSCIVWLFNRHFGKIIQNLYNKKVKALSIIMFDANKELSQLLKISSELVPHQKFYLQL